MAGVRDWWQPFGPSCKATRTERGIGGSAQGCIGESCLTHREGHKPEHKRYVENEPVPASGGGTHNSDAIICIA